jgi:hypothetical protein
MALTLHQRERRATAQAPSAPGAQRRPAVASAGTQSDFDETAPPMAHAHHHVRNRLRPWQRPAVDAVGALLLVSGVVWLPLHYGRGADALPLPAEAWLMRLHGLAAFGALFMLGVLAGGHVPHGWRATASGRGRTQRRSGLVLCTAAALLVASGYLLYYFAPDNVRPPLGLVHSAIGVAMAAALWIHRRAAHGRGKTP